MRDLKADLELCNKATPGPWVFNGISVLGAHGLLIARTPNDADAEFIAQAREGWPHAIERALKAEELNRELVETLKNMRELLTKAKEVLGGEPSNDCRLI
jgi:hypothetical protein